MALSKRNNSSGGSVHRQRKRSHVLLLMFYGLALAVTLVPFMALERVPGFSSASHHYDDAASALLTKDDDEGGGEGTRAFGIAAMPPVDGERAERMGPMTIFVHGTSPNGTGASCECNILDSTDCLLSSLPCVPRTLRSLRRSVARGVAIRSSLRETLSFDNWPSGSSDGVHAHGFEMISYLSHPVGKVTQYTVMEAWDRYTRHLPLSRNYFTMRSVFVNRTAYEFCVKRDLTGKDCFFRPIWEGDHDENGDGEKYVDPMEKDAIEHAEGEAMEGAGRALETYRNASRSISEVEPDDPEWWKRREGNPSALDHLLVFAHLLRMHFDVRPHILYSYKKYLVTVPAVRSISGKAREGDRPNDKHTIDNASDECIMPLRVGLHVRRADACEHEKETDGKGEDGRHRYLDRASDIQSDAQVTGKRYCYDTKVYMDVLRRIQQSMWEESAPGCDAGDGRKPPMEIYLSTDYAGQLLHDIEMNFPDLYESCTWKYLNFPREAFVYDAAIELSHNRHKQGNLGEFAVEDLWHLGHAQVFVGHMGELLSALLCCVPATIQNRPIVLTSDHKILQFLKVLDLARSGGSSPQPGTTPSRPTSRLTARPTAARSTKTVESPYRSSTPWSIAFCSRTSLFP